MARKIRYQERETDRSRAKYFMLDFSTIILLPFVLAFLVFVVRFYGRESASSMSNPSFMLACFTVLSAAAYLLLRVSDLLPGFGTIGFGLLGLVLFGTAIARMFMI